MGDFVAFSEDIDNGMEFLQHHQILGAKWGQKNGPPYPLGSGDHSSSEKTAAKAAGITVGSDSGKGSIENVKKKKSPAQNATVKKASTKEMTPEERRQAALEAVRTGDKKKIAKYIDELSTEELRDAQNRAQMRDSLTKKDPSEQKASKEDVEKMEAMRSGDKEKVKEYADKMSYSELSEAMNKVNLMAQLNHVDPPPSAMDKLEKVMNNVDKFRQAAEKGVNAYNLAAKVYNSTHKGKAQWPIIENQQQKQKSTEEKVAENLFKQVGKDVQNTVQSNQQKSFEQQQQEKLKNAKIEYKTKKEFEDWVAKQEGKDKSKEQPKPQQQNNQEQQSKPQQNDQEKPKYDRKEGEGEDARYYYDDAYNKAKDRKLSDYDDTPSYDDLIPDDVKDVMNRKVS